MAGPLIVILGPTASGKSSLAMQLAKKFEGELICADSRTVYRGMDIGTAKPPMHDRKEVTHHLLDVINPDESFSAAKFKELALGAIDRIQTKGKLPIVVGGTGLYIDSLIYDFAFLPTISNEPREELEKLSIEKLQQKLKNENIDLPLNSKNKRHLIRAIETNGQIPVKKGLRENTLLIGLAVKREEIKARIESRINTMIEEGLLSEVEDLCSKYNWQDPGMLSTGYKAMRSYKEGNQGLEDAKQQFARNDYQYARRQMTWFKRNEHIKWVDEPNDAIKLVQKFLQQNM